MKKKTSRQKVVISRTIPTLRKLSPQLNLLLALGLPAVRQQCLAEREDRLAQQAKMAELAKPLASERHPERRAALERQISGILDRIPNSLVHAVYFPTDAKLKGDAPAKLREPFISAFIKAHCTHQDLQRLGIRVRQQAGDIFTAFVPWRMLKRLAAMPGIDFVELARPVRSDLNNALPYNQVSNLQGPPASLTGAGVIVGVLDSFLYFYHPDFRNNDGAGGDGQGSTRVLFIWDQALAPQAGESGPVGIAGFTPAGGATYGVEYSQANINTDLNNFGPPPAAGQLPTSNAYQTVRHQTPAVNNNTAHGTHVCGIAAGNGRALGGTFMGGAPGSAIIFVRDIVNNNAFGDATTVTDAFAYVFARAALLGQPCVVNMSQSDNMGPHDGTSLGEQFLDNLLLTPGRAITVAAGNTNNQGEHTSGTVPAGGTTNVNLTFGPGNATSNEFAEIWYDGHDAFDVTLTIPTVPATVIGPIAPGASSAVTALPNGVNVQIVHTQNDPRNGDNVISLFITNVNAMRPIPNGNWAFQLAGTTVINGAFEGWVDRNNRGNRTWAAPDTTSNSIAVPASGLRVIAVGSHDRSGPPPNIVGSSSVGPSRDNRIKPDISAVGNNVNSTWIQLINTINPGAAYNAIGGTSMASPLVAGATALLFECRGAGLTWSDVKQLLQDTAGVPAVGVPSNQFGWGYLQAANLCAGPVPDVDVWLRDHVADTGVEPFTGGITWLSPDIEVLDLAGNPVSNPTHDPANFINNLIRVTVRNRGAQTARNIEVHLYWSDPATNIPFPSEWRPAGIFTGDPNFVAQSNKIIVPQLAAGASTQVRFGWAPPAPGSNLRGDDHFCLIARLEQEDDASNVSTGGWSAIGGSNNIALRNTHVQPAAGGDGDTAFYVTGSDDHAALEVETEKLDGRVELVLPVQALPWRDLDLINRTGTRRPFGADCGNDPLAGRKAVIKAAEAKLRTGIEGLAELRFEGGNVRLIAARDGRLTIPDIRIKPGVKMPARLLVRGAKIGKTSGFAHVRQRSGGKTIGGITLELAPKVLQAKPMKALLEKGRLVIR